jgi:hypothetical protein
VEDPTRMSKDESFEEEILGRMQKILKDIGCIPLKIEERDVDHPLAAVSKVVCILSLFVLNLCTV